MAKHPTGWIRDDDAVAEVRAELGNGDGIDLARGSVREPLLGYSRGQVDRGNSGVFPHLAELSFRKKFTAPYAQNRGVCVGCGTATAIEMSWLFALAHRGQFGRAVRVDAASIYAGSRTQRDLGNNRLGRGDGSVGAWAAKWVHDHGAIEQTEVGGVDLRGLNESAAVNWGAPGKGVPEAVLSLGDGIRINCFFADTAQKIFDCAYAGFGMAWCDDFTFGPKNGQGISRMNQRASHCTALFGGAISEGGSELVGGQQSWGVHHPQGPNTLRYKGGQVPLRQGMCFVPLDDLDKRLRSGAAECWAFQVIEGWRPKA